MSAFHPRPLLFLALVSLALGVASCDDAQDQPIATIDFAQRLYEPTPLEADRNGDPLLEGALAWPYTLHSAALPGAEPNARWQSNPKGGMLITAPIQGPKFEEHLQDPGEG
ncbi:MAG: hypothetical protein AAFV77_09905 [Planctomycetota bacterium]